MRCAMLAVLMAGAVAVGGEPSAMDREEARAFLDLARTALDKGDLDKAEAWLVKSEQKAPSPALLELRATIKVKRNDPTGALWLYVEAVKAAEEKDRPALWRKVADLSPALKQYVDKRLAFEAECRKYATSLLSDRPASSLATADLKALSGATRPAESAQPEPIPGVPTAGDVERLRKGDPRGIRFARTSTPEGGKFVPLAAGAKVWNDGDYTFPEVPAVLQGAHYLQQKKHAGVTKFEVTADGVLLLAVGNDWGGGGNAQGGWKERCTPKDKFLADGWQEVCPLRASEGGWTVYARPCKAGEKFDLQTEKYAAPVILWR